MEAEEIAQEFVGRRDEVESNLVSAGIIDQVSLKRAADRYNIWGEHFVDTVCGYVFAIIYDWMDGHAKEWMPPNIILELLLLSDILCWDEWQLRCRFAELLRDDWRMVKCSGKWGDACDCDSVVLLSDEIETLAAAMADLRSRQDKVQWHLRQAQEISAGLQYVGMDTPREGARAAYKRLVGSPRKRAKT